MIEIVWRYEPADKFVEPSPDTWTQAVELIDRGNAAFARLGTDTPDGRRLVLPVTPEDLGLGHVPGEPPRQAPFAALVGCADARVPLELLMSQSANDIFVVRVAGNVLANEGVGSLTRSLISPTCDCWASLATPGVAPLERPLIRTCDRLTTSASLTTCRCDPSSTH